MEVYIYILLVPLGCTEIEAANSECEAPAALKGSAAFVTCRFDSDISKLRQDFEVRRVPVNVSVMNSEVVISCYWNQEKTVCRSRPDYLLDSRVTSQFTVKITKVGNRHAGKFYCILVSHDPGMYDYCELVVTESRTSTFPTLLTTKPNSFKEVSTRSVRYNVDTSEFSILNRNGSDQHKERTSPLTTDAQTILLAIALPAVLIILTICVIFFILRKCKKECCKIVFKGDESANQKSRKFDYVNCNANYIVKNNGLDFPEYKELADLQPIATHKT